MSRVKTTAELKSYWNAFKETYVSTFQEFTTIVYNLLLLPSNLSTSTKIVEAGCGAGNGVLILRSLLPDSIEIFANDLSESMLEVGISRNLPNTHWAISPNEQLPYPDSFCDRYISNLSLMIVENPQQMLEEAFRVLQSGGRATFSVWGKPQTNDMFGICGRCCKEAGYTSSSRSSFHLGEEETLRKMLEAAGFRRVLVQSSCVVLGFECVEDAMAAAGKSTLMLEVKENSEEVYRKAEELIREEFRKVMQDGHPLVFDCLIATGVKE